MPEATLILIENVQLIMDDEIWPDGWVILEDNTIKARGRGSLPKSAENLLQTGSQRIDGGGYYLAPGFIELHTHGAGGCDFMDGTVDSWRTISRTHAEHGTTALLATTLTSTAAELAQTLSVWQQWSGSGSVSDLGGLAGDGACILGLHLEGPYFAQSQRGAQDPRFIRNPDPDEYKPLMDQHPEIKRWTAAPELPGSSEFAEYARSKGIIVAIGHSDALYPQVIEAVEAGFNLITHLYSGMSGVTRVAGIRQGGVIEAGLICDELTVEVIADGRHLPLELLELIWRCKGRERIALVTDSMRAAGQNVQESIIGSLKNGQPVIIRDQVAKLPDATALAGSIATADRLLRTMLQVPGVRLVDAVYMLTRTPARILGLSSRKGQIAPGYDADLVLFNKQSDILRTIVGGKTVYAPTDLKKS